MDKETKNETKKEGSPTADAGEGSESKTTLFIERAREEREKLDAANAKHEELLNREEAIIAKRELGGRSEGGIEKKEETEDEKWAKDAKIRYAGTGLDPTDDEDGIK